MTSTTVVPMALSGACNQAWGLGSLILLIIGGLIIGFLGRVLAPGDRDSIPLWLTLVVGVAGILIGTWLYVDVFGGKCATGGVDWIRHLVQIITAAVLVVITAGMAGRRRA